MPALRPKKFPAYNNDFLENLMGVLWKNRKAFPGPVSFSFIRNYDNSGEWMENRFVHKRRTLIYALGSNGIMTVRLVDGKIELFRRTGLYYFRSVNRIFDVILQTCRSLSLDHSADSIPGLINDALSGCFARLTDTHLLPQPGPTDHAPEVNDSLK